MSKFAMFKGQKVEIGPAVKGWIPVTFPDGKTGSARQNQLTAIGQAPEAEPNTERRNGVVNPKYLSRYIRVKVDGIVSRDNADRVAIMLRGLELDDVYVVAADILGTSEQDLRKKYAHLNNGQQRMSLGNRMRKTLKNTGTGE